MKIRLTLLAFLFLPMLTWAQTIVPIQNIQGWTGQFLPDSCNDGPNPVYLGNTVTVRAVVITRGGLNLTTGQTRWIWVRDVTASPSTPYGNITVRASAATTPTDINSLIEGDTVEITGIVAEFNGTNAGNGETQLNPNPGGVQLISEVAGPAPLPFLVNVGEINGELNTNNQPNNLITSGEKYEGNFLEIQNVQVVNVDLSVADRCRILVKDANNNHIWIYDRFNTQRISNGFVPPNVGDSYTSVKGVLEGWKNGCAGSATGNRGYNLNPFSLTHYVKGASSPSISRIKKSVICPSSLTPVNISMDATDADGSVSSVEVLFSTTGVGAYTAVPATVLGTRYTATIPAQTNGSLVRFYVRAKDNLNNTTVLPNVPANIVPIFYAVNDAGCTIKDIQFTPYANGRSGYVGDTVIVQGVVTASASPDNLGFVYIQQPGQTSWSGLWVNGGSLITGLNVGDLVTVTGSIDEYFGLTRISNISNATVNQTGQTVPSPVSINPADLTTYSFQSSEQYESMLVKLDGANLFVVDSNADAAVARNNGEYRIGADLNDPNTGCRVLAGRQNNQTFSSLNVKYVNSPIWATVDGVMNVAPEIVTPGSTVNKAIGILSYSFGNMKLIPRNNADMDIVISNNPLLSEKQMALYPNPAFDKIMLDFDANNMGAKVEIFNNHGQNISQKIVESNHLDMDVKSYPAGLYRLRVSDKSGNMIAIRNLAISK